jgi:hypothetical protein
MKKDESKIIIPAERVEQVIYFIRGQRVILDQDLAVLYGVQTKRLNEQVHRNADRFPEDFAFQLTKEEWVNLKSQIATSSWGGRRKLPIAFTEQGVAMAANILKSKQATLISIEIVRAFIRLRQILATHKEMAKELADLKAFTLKHSNANDREFKRVWDAIDKIINPPVLEEPRRIGFNLGQ